MTDKQKIAAVHDTVNTYHSSQNYSYSDQMNLYKLKQCHLINANTCVISSPV